jgi:Tetratricopeptide repeat/PEGA domain
MKMRAASMCLLLLAAVGAPAAARPKKAPANAAAPAPPSPAQQRFQRALDLYQEGNLDAARAELQRAYEMAPTYKLLYNLGQIYYELHDYPAALAAFEKYLSEGAGKVPEARRLQVESDIEKLKARVARIAVAADVPQADVSVDDVVVGSTPLAAPIVVSAGRRKITVTKNGYVPFTRWIEVAGGDSSEVDVDLEEASSRPAAPATPVAVSRVADTQPPDATRRDGGRSSGWLWAGWVAAGTFAIGAGVGGALAYAASRELKSERSQLGANRADLDRKAGEVRDLSLAADICGGLAIAAAGVTLVLTLSRGHESPERASVRLVPGPGSLGVAGTF